MAYIGKAGELVVPRTSFLCITMRQNAFGLNQTLGISEVLFAKENQFCLLIYGVQRKQGSRPVISEFQRITRFLEMRHIANTGFASRINHRKYVSF
jgi:hypothetical protein